MFRKNNHYTEEWELYEKGKEYHHSIGLYDNVNTNERFYRGDQWEGVQSGGLPTPVFNLFRRIIDFFVSTVLSISAGTSKKWTPCLQTPCATRR